MKLRHLLLFKQHPNDDTNVSIYRAVRGEHLATLNVMCPSFDGHRNKVDISPVDRDTWSLPSNGKTNKLGFNCNNRYNRLPHNNIWQYQVETDVCVCVCMHMNCTEGRMKAIVSAPPFIRINWTENDYFFMNWCYNADQTHERSWMKWGKFNSLYFTWWMDGRMDDRWMGDWLMDG